MIDWLDLGTFTLTGDWQYSPQVTTRDFKIVYLNSVLLARNSIGLISLADMPESEVASSSEFFKPQRITAYLPSEIIRFPDPPKKWHHRLAFKQLIFANQQLSNLRIQIYMPAYSIAPASNNNTSNVNSNVVAVDNTKSVTLSAAAVGKMGSTIVNNSKVAKLYISLGSAASLTNYDKILNYQELYETPFNYSGDVLGIWDKADAAGNARVKDFS